MLGKRLPSHQGDGQHTTRVERDQREGYYWLRGWRLQLTTWLCCQGQKTPEAKNREEEEEEELLLVFFSFKHLCV